MVLSFTIAPIAPNVLFLGEFSLFYEHKNGPSTSTNDFLIKINKF
jgi:hypothetical protein